MSLVSFAYQAVTPNEDAGYKDKHGRQHKSPRFHARAL